jgi:hypothetical protein
VPEFHGLFRTDPPALAASGAQAHVVHQDAFAGMIPVIEGQVRTIPDAGQATVALLVHDERRHVASTLSGTRARGRRPSSRSRSHTVHFHFNGFDIVDGFWLAETDALRISVAMVAFENLPARFVELHHTEGTGRNAHPAGDAETVVDQNAVEIFGPGDGLPGTYRHTGRIQAVLAVHGKMETLRLPLNHPDAGECRAADALVPQRACHLAFSAAVAFFGFYDQLLGHGPSLSMSIVERALQFFSGV